MKVIIDGRRYDTDTAEEVGDYWNGYGYSDFRYLRERLYRTQKGAWFLFGEGACQSEFAQHHGSRVYDGTAITLLTAEEAMSWLEIHNENDGLERWFSDSIADA